MEAILATATPIAGMLGLAALLLLRKLLSTNGSVQEAPGAADLSPNLYQRMPRLLDPEDFAYARERGLRPATLRRLRAVRRKIFRAYLRDVIRDFERTHRALRQVVVQSATDRADLASELAWQTVTFYRAVLITQVRLSLHACGFDHVANPTDLFRPIETLRGHIHELAPAAALG